MSPCSRTEKQIKKNISVNKIVKVSQELGKFLPKTVFQVFFTFESSFISQHIKSFNKIF